MKKIVGTFACVVMLFAMSAVCFAECDTFSRNDSASEVVCSNNPSDLSGGNAQMNNAVLSSELEKLETPQNLAWNVDVHGNTAMGHISWDVVPNSTGAYYLQVFCNGNFIYETSWHGLYDRNGTGRVSVDLIGPSVFSQSGAYTFEITAEGDDINYSDSDVAVSGVYDFVCPTVRLGTPQNVRWLGDGIIKHSPVANAGGYIYTFYDNNDKKIGSSWYVNSNVITDNRDVEEDESSYVIDMLGWLDDVEYIYVKVVALTNNPELWQNSLISAPTNCYTVDNTGALIGGTISSLIDEMQSGTTAEETLNNFLDSMERENISNFDIAVAMQQKETLVDDIEQLEIAYQNETGVEVRINDYSTDGNYLAERGIDVNNVTVKGAALNSENKNDITINFSEPSEGLSFDEMFYTNSVAVNISMEGVKNQKNLAVPVQITMPVPEDVYPHNLVILHYHADGTFESILPNVIDIDGVSYVQFVVTSFSDFVLCENTGKYNYGTYTTTQSVENGTEFEVQFMFEIESGNSVVLALYKSDVLVDLQIAEYKGETIEFFSSADYNSASVLVWNNLTDMIPVCVKEPVDE